MPHLLFVAGADDRPEPIQSLLGRYGFICIQATYERALQAAEKHPPELVLAEIDAVDNTCWGHIKKIKLALQKPIIALADRNALDGLINRPEVDDFILLPADERELVTRVKRLIGSTEKKDGEAAICCGDLVIDPATCEVTVAGRQVELTFKEYELLKLLAANRGRVFTRAALLDAIWGYDYYGGDRTVDVHIRRLRSKIEDGRHTFIETVRNIGYRFTRNDLPAQAP